MSRVEINFTKICPYLIKNPASLKPMVVDLQTNMESGDRCEVGEETLDAEVLTDLMLKPKMVDVGVSCEGCVLLPSGFSKSVRVKVRD